MSKEKQIYADFMKKLESLLMECNAELQADGNNEITVEFIGTRPRPNVIGFWMSIGVHLYPGCDEFIEAESLLVIAESNAKDHRGGTETTSTEQQPSSAAPVNPLVGQSSTLGNK